MVKNGRAQLVANHFRVDREPGRILASPVTGDKTQVFRHAHANYGSSSFDKVMSGKVVGHSMFTGYSHNERCGRRWGGWMPT
jgi:hypothetical protein